MPARSAKQLSAALESLTELAAESSQQMLREALASGDARLITRAAKLATEHSLSALLQPLASA
jgi:hypothetical protein